jgi:hypothetical protein
MENGETFKLTPEEDFQFGVLLKEGELRFRPNRLRIVTAVGTFAGGAVAAVSLILQRAASDVKVNGHALIYAIPLRILGFAILTYTSFYAWNAYRSGVVANSTGLQLRQGRHHLT